MLVVVLVKATRTAAALDRRIMVGILGELDSGTWAFDGVKSQVAEESSMSDGASYCVKVQALLQYGAFGRSGMREAGFRVPIEDNSASLQV